MRYDMLGTPMAIRNTGTRLAPIWWSIVHLPDADLWFVVHEAAGSITVQHRGVDPAHAIACANALMNPDVMPFSDEEISAARIPAQPLQDALWA